MVTVTANLTKTKIYLCQNRRSLENKTSFFLPFSVPVFGCKRMKKAKKFISTRNVTFTSKFDISFEIFHLV